MAEQVATKVYANFSGGLVTEGNLLSYPESAAADMDNLNLRQNGSIARRAGLAHEGTSDGIFPLVAAPLAETAFGMYNWENVAGDSSINITVIQTGDTLHFHHSDGDVLNPANKAANDYLLTNTVRSSSSSSLGRIKGKVAFTDLGGRLYIAGKFIDPAIIEYDTSTSSNLVVTTVFLKMRDFDVWGEGEVQDFLSTEYSVAGEKSQQLMPGKHSYNLINQGWPSDESVTGGPLGGLPIYSHKPSYAVTAEGGGAVFSDPKRYLPGWTFSKINNYPTTNNDYVSNLHGAGTSVVEQKAYNPWLLTNTFTSGSSSPRGHNILQALNIYKQGTGHGGSIVFGSPDYDAWQASGLPSQVEVTDALTRPDSLEAYAGRVWYTGVEGDTFSTNIYFSQIINNNIVRAGKCYQEADPTAESINELVATDGGVISIEGMGKVRELVTFGSSLVVIAANGVWSISGTDGNSFTATSFSVQKLPSEGSISKETIVQSGSSVFFWGESSIYALATNEVGAVLVQDISEASIQTLYQSISLFSRENAFSIYDEGSRKVLWFYADSADISFTDFPGKAYNKVLYLDLALNAYGKYTLELDITHLPLSVVNVGTTDLVTLVDPIYDVEPVEVTDSGVPVVDTLTFTIPDKSSLRLLTFDTATSDYTMSTFTDVDTFSDWGNNYISYLETGFDSLEDIIKKAKRAPLSQFHFSRTEDGFVINPDDPEGEELIFSKPSGCLVSYVWDWGDNYGNQFQAYKYLRNYTPVDVDDPLDYNRDVISTRHRLRGRGTSVGFRFESEEGKDMQLLGYGILFANRGRV